MGFTLYVGVDESNHGNKKGGEILVATFSILDGDGEIFKQGNKRDYRGSLEYVSEAGRDWNFTVRFDERYKHRGQNISLVLPTLVNHYLDDFGEEVSEICAYLDGEVRTPARKALLDNLYGLSEVKNLERVSVEAFTKKKVTQGSGVSKRYECPRLVWVADSIANGLYRNEPLEKLLNHRKMVTPLIDKRV